MEFAVEIAGAASKASGLEVIPWALMYFCGPTEDRMMQFVAAAGAGREIGNYPSETLEHHVERQ